eukprot:CAMPEP_0202477828 /NCGR_PEP_ID=MMETSP1360-20130828/94145_1 /ASSEMBLY_ACC=CAM_ASM_000848 /TAXON_ID=515479 /ORGANISM="Licmophora paradoxa, Strain CCMP2313" /LENGTH=129 /DNA_ID=CAMNT_0049105085 /DNA_START=758 /DNA_END=1147 /DNA_ORIENTATION=-
MALVTAFGGLLFLTSCMKRYDATYSSAMFVGSFVFSASIMSVVHYKTFENLESIWNYILYPAGLAVLTVGVGILVQEADQSSSNGMSNSRNNSIHEILIQNEHIAVDLQSTQDQEETAQDQEETAGEMQ